jgi:Zn-dependent peptidase ImmA (M78 family)/transcriptional regulator with XRE-family HTH domain
MDEQFNPAMLVLARESRGISQSELAKRLRVSQGNLSKIEGGLISADDILLTKIAEVLNYPKSFFFQVSPPHGFASNCLYHRKRQTVRISDLRRVAAELKIYRLQIDNLLRSVHIEVENKFHRMDVVEYSDSPELIAQLMRRSWGLPPGPIVNLTESIEAAGGIVIHCSFGTGKIDAMSQWAAGSPPLFFMSAEAPGDRLRFSLAHEIGHVVMHQTPTEDIEGQADRFASEFLMPKKDISAFLNRLSIPKLASLKSYWRVSMGALIERAHNLKKLTPYQREYLWKQMSRMGYRTREPVDITVEEPKVIKQVLAVHVGELGYDTSELSEIVHSGESEFKRKFLQERGGGLRLVEPALDQHKFA